MEEKYKVSVLVPLYNQERYLDACMRSICNQTYRNLEIIVVNDGSTDRSPQLLDRWAARDGRIRVINKANEGLVNARRDAYRVATGELITFVDSDDLLPLGAIETLVRNLVEQDVDLVIGAMQRKLGFIKQDANRGTFPVGEVVRQPELFEKYYCAFFGVNCFFVSMWAKLFKKSAIDRALQETELFATRIRFMGEDLHFNMKLFPYLESMYRIDDVVYYYRIGGGSEDHFNPRYPELFTLCDIRMELLDKYDYTQAYDPLYQEYARKVYYHAHQLLEFKQADRQGVKAFFEQELAQRATAQRMAQFYADKSAPNPEVAMMLKGDSDAMCDYVEQWVQSRHRTLRYKVKTLLLKLIERM